MLNILLEKNEKKIKQWINSNGKKAKPVSPIYLFSDLSEESFKNIKEKYNLGGKRNE